MAVPKEQVERHSSSIAPVPGRAKARRPGFRKRLLRSPIRKFDSALLRNTVQISISVFMLYVGWQFYRFVKYFEDPQSARFVERPPSVEGFLPISALLSLKNWLLSGVWDEIHPAGLTILLAVIAISFLFKKAFCSWICPIGTASEMIWKFGRRILGSNLVLPRWLDIALRSLKYLILAFFVKITLIDLSVEAIRAFLASDYNKIADVKMLYFFLSPSTLTIAVLGVLFIGSLLIKNFWCRYLCPYGALLGIISLASPFKIRRDSDLCIDCGKCARACPSMIQVDKLDSVNSADCTGCMDCVASCPKPGALNMSPGKEFKTPSWVVYTLILAVFFGAVLVAKYTGHWETSLTFEEYRRLIPVADNLSHPY